MSDYLRTICRHCEIDYGRHNSSVCVRSQGSHEWHNVLDHARQTAELTAENERLRRQVETLRTALGCVSRMRTMPNHAMNTTTLVAAHQLAAQALAEADRVEE
jgi:hypothetical protein